MNKKTIGIYFIAMLSCLTMMAQDVHFSQFRETPLLVNPAQTALNTNLRFTMNYKDQWRSVASPYQTFAFSGEGIINKKKEGAQAGIGFQFLRDKAGDSRMGITQAMISASGIVNLNNYNKLSAGLIGGMGQRSINYNDLQWSNQYVNGSFSSSNASKENLGTTSYIYPDVGVGFCWTYGKEQRTISSNDGIKATLGFSGWHFSVPKYSFGSSTAEKLNTKFVAHGNVHIGLQNKNTVIVPEFLFTRQGDLQEINAGTMVKYILKEESKITGYVKASALSMGLNYRYKDAAIVSFIYEYSNYALGLSYDVNLSSLTSQSRYKGGLEVSLRFVSPKPYLRSSTSSLF